jgi:hypothetical protein
MGNDERQDERGMQPEGGWKWSQGRDDEDTEGHGIAPRADDQPMDPEGARARGESAAEDEDTEGHGLRR